MGSEAEATLEVEDTHTHYEGIGLSPGAGWYNAAVMNSVVGVMVILMHAFTDWLPPGVEVIGYVTAGLVPIWILGAIFMPEAQWAVSLMPWGRGHRLRRGPPVFGQAVRHDASIVAEGGFLGTFET